MADHPYFFTWTRQKSARPFELVGGDGAWFETADGGRWLDLASLSYNANAGHGNRVIMEAIAEQARTLSLSMPNTHHPAKRALAERLLAMAPDGFDRVFFTLGGSEANENAIKIARMLTGRYKMVSRYRSYHGATMGAVSLTGDWRRLSAEPAMAGAVHALDCYCDRCPFGKTVDSCDRECASHIGELLELEGNVAAVILEPVPGANGVLVPPDDYWPKVRAACDRAGALLIADEVLTGFGRTGKALGIDHWDAVPDMITISKGVTGGYATLGAVLVHHRVSSHFDDRVLSCGLTGYGHPLGCAAGVAAIDFYRDNDLYRRSAELGPVLLGALASIRDAHPDRTRAVRGLGLLACIELDLSDAEWRKLDAGLAARTIYTHLYPERGSVVFAPPLVIGEDELTEGLGLFGEALKEAIA